MSPPAPSSHRSKVELLIELLNGRARIGSTPTQRVCEAASLKLRVVLQGHARRVRLGQSTDPVYRHNSFIEVDARVKYHAQIRLIKFHRWNTAILSIHGPPYQSHRIFPAMDAA